MATNDRADEFAEALQHFEGSGEVARLAALFAEGAELRRPELDSAAASQDVSEFWRSYREQFSEVRSDFGHVDEGGHLAVLEWTSSGKLATGRDIEYDGVSVLTFDDDDRVRRFATFYDTAAFLEHP